MEQLIKAIGLVSSFSVERKQELIERCQQNALTPEDCQELQEKLVAEIGKQEQERLVADETLTALRAS